MGAAICPGIDAVVKKLRVRGGGLDRDHPERLWVHSPGPLAGQAIKRRASARLVKIEPQGRRIGRSSAPAPATDLKIEAVLSFAVGKRRHGPWARALVIFARRSTLCRRRPRLEGCRRVSLSTRYRRAAVRRCRAASVAHRAPRHKSVDDVAPRNARTAREKSASATPGSRAANATEASGVLIQQDRASTPPNVGHAPSHRGLDDIAPRPNEARPQIAGGRRRVQLNRAMCHLKVKNYQRLPQGLLGRAGHRWLHRSRRLFRQGKCYLALDKCPWRGVVRKVLELDDGNMEAIDATPSPSHGITRDAAVGVPEVTVRRRQHRTPSRVCRPKINQRRVDGVSA